MTGLQAQKVQFLKRIDNIHSWISNLDLQFKGIVESGLKERAVARDAKSALATFQRIQASQDELAANKQRRQAAEWNEGRPLV